MTSKKICFWKSMVIFISMRNRDWDKDPENLESIRKSKREWYHRNKSVVAAHAKKNREKAKQWVNNVKSNLGCKCGETHISVLDCHHLDPSKKEIRIADAIRRGWSIPRLQRELKKCIVMCSNCHRKLHWRERNAAVIGSVF